VTGRPRSDPTEATLAFGRGAREARTALGWTLEELSARTGMGLGSLDEGHPVTEIFESPRELVAFVCATRRDWTEDETQNAIQACRTAGHDWSRIALGMVVLALRDETPPTRPRELWGDVWGSRSRTGPGGRLDPAAKAQAIADCQAAAESLRQPAVTGGQPALREGGDDP
jgi:hypothetical protein